MRPADNREIRVVLDKLFAFAQTFGLLPKAPDAEQKAMTDALGFYAAGLAHVPPDLIARSVDRAISNHRWGNRLPLPADLIALIQAELDDRRAVLIRLETIDRQARKAASYDRGEPEVDREDPEERARRAAAVDEILRGLPQVAGI